MTTPVTPVEPRTAVMRLTLLDGSTWTDKGIRDFAAYLGQQFEMRVEPEAAGVPLLREALERIVTDIGEHEPWLLERAKGTPNEGRVLADVIVERAALAAAAPTVEPVSDYDTNARFLEPQRAAAGLDVLASDEFREAVRIVFEKPGEWGPGQGYYRHFISEFIQLLRQEYDRLAAEAAAKEQRS